MAELDIKGFDAFAANLEAARDLSEEEAYRILEAGGDVVKRSMQAKLTALGLVLSRRLVDSIKVVRKVLAGAPYVLIFPQGKHHSYHGRDGKGRRGKGSLKTADASEVAFVFEYGAPSRNIPAYHWMEQAITESEDETTEAMQAEFNAILDSKGVGRQ